jgi:ribosomal protein L11 methyltransferase
MSDRWIELAVELPQAHAARVGDLLIALGATGLSEDHPGLHFPGDSGPLVAGTEWQVPETPSPTGRVRLSGWFEPDHEPAHIVSTIERRLAELGVDGEAKARRVDNEDWSATWKAHWQPERLSDRIVVAPSWCADVQAPRNGHVLRIDPGMAFGTGTHATTAACADLADRWLSARSGTVLDVGTGTGILALAALLLGADRAVGCDTDPAAVEAAVDNATRAGLSARFEALEGGVDAVDGRFDLVFANLLAPLLVELAAPLAATLAAGGCILASGMLLSQADGVLAAFAAQGFGEVERIERDGWAALRLERT